MDNRSQSEGKRAIVPVAILTILVAYGVALCVGWPQLGTQQIVAAQLHPPASAIGGESHNFAAPPLWTVVPFVLLLAGIAVLPLIPHTSHWWESNLNRFKVAGGLALVTIAYYAFLHSGGLDGHWPAHHVVSPGEGLRTDLVNTILANAMLPE